MTQPAATQSRYPWRAVARTVAAVALALLPLLPAIADQLGIAAVPVVAAVLAAAAAITRVLAIPEVDMLLRRYLPWLATTPTLPPGR